jgi:hypothetical protein|tara:strand:+ start:78 stop:452 length:375 start_codon:yes stop_codon:yes gene_type:complete
MAAQGNWTVIFEDRCVIKNFAEGANKGIGYIIDDESFWSDSKFSNIWAIQYGTSTPTDEVEYRDETQHTTYADANLGDINQFSSRWDAVHLSQLQANWDSDSIDDETEAEKIARIGERPTSYSS